jgi:phage shock protein C
MVNVKRPLYRIPKQGKIAGVCAGLADYFDFDVTLVRVIFVVSAFISGGAVVLLYIIMAVILPVDDGSTAKAHASVKDEPISEKFQKLGRDLKDNGSMNRMRNYFGFGLLVFGSWLLLSQIFPEWGIFRWEFIWPIVLIAIGVLIIVKRSGDGK